MMVKATVTLEVAFETKQDVSNNFCFFVCKSSEAVSWTFTKLPRPSTFFIKRLWHCCFPVNFAKFFRTAFIMENFWWLLLNYENSKQKWRCLVA